MRFVAIVITYYPEKELLLSNIRSFIDYVDKVLIWENTPESEKMQFRFIEGEKIEYCGDGENSISKALNYAWKYAENNGFDFLLTMDQDSRFNNFDFYKDSVLKHSTCHGVCIWTPEIEGYNISCLSDIVEIKMPITSGMILPVKALNIIGGWNEFFQIDSVDDDFSLRAHSFGIKTFLIKGALMKQCFGNPVVRRFMGHEINLRNYSSRRLYEIYRNNLILIRKYPQFDYIKKNFRNVWIKQILWILLFEKKKFYKLISIIRGCFVGLTIKI